MKLDKILVKKYPLFVGRYKAEKGRDGIFLLGIGEIGDILYKQMGPLLGLGGGKYRKIKIGFTSCGGSDFYVIDLKKLPKRKAGQPYRMQTVMDALEVHGGTYVLDQPYGKRGLTQKWIEVHGGRDIIVYFMVYDVRETIARSVFNAFANGIVGSSNYSDIKDMEAILQSTMGAKDYQYAYKKVNDQAKNVCRQVVDIPFGNAMCQHLMDADVSFRLIAASGQALCSH